MKRFSFLFILLFLSHSVLYAAETKLKIITTLFPLYDFARSIGRNKVSVTLLLPPGTEAHSYEPSAGDILRINQADIFIYTNRIMEPWVDKIIRGTDNRKLTVLAAGMVMPDGDPHVWLDFSLAADMVNTIRDALINRDPGNKDSYLEAAREYNVKLSALDKEYTETLARCRNKTLIYSGHFAFGYQARRYHLQYLSAYKGFSPDAEPTPRDLAELIEKIKKYKVQYVFYEELVSPRLAD